MEPPPEHLDDLGAQQREPLAVDVIVEHERPADALRRDVEDAVVAELRSRHPSHRDRR